MTKIILTIVSTIIFLPLPSLAADLNYEYSSDSNSEQYIIHNDRYVVTLVNTGSQLQAQAWSDNHWTSTETLFSHDLGDSLLRSSSIFELTDGTILVSLPSEQLVMYSNKTGFRYYPNSPFIDDVVIDRHYASLISCNTTDDTGYAYNFDQTIGLTGGMPLVGSHCDRGDEFTAFIGKNGVIMDYYSGQVYDASNNYAVIAQTDSSIVKFNIDDPQGDVPERRLRKNGDIVFGFHNYLYGYVFNEHTWRSKLKLADEFSLLNDYSSTEYDELLLQTNDQEEVLAFASNQEHTKYQLYHWTSTQGWQLETTYTFVASTELILPKNNRQVAAVYWGFWTDELDEFNIYSWTKQRQSQLVSKRILSDGQSLSLDVSRAGKLFLSWHDATAIRAAVWTRASQRWDDHTLVQSSEDVELDKTHITWQGSWIMTYRLGKKLYAHQWRYDGRWSQPYNLIANASYFNEDQHYTVDLKPDHVLEVKRFNWNSKNSTVIDTVQQVHSFSQDAFILKDYIFILYKSLDSSENIQEIAL